MSTSGIEVDCVVCQSRLQSDHYRCLQCSHFDICMSCVRMGYVCSARLSCRWIERVFKRGRVTDQGRGMSVDNAREAQTSIPNRFYPPDNNNAPGSLFKKEERFIRETNPEEILIYTKGAWSIDSVGSYQAGYAFQWRPPAPTEVGTVWSRLENKGPTGQRHTLCSEYQSYFRAQLRAAVAALQFRDWSTDCNGNWKNVIITTGSLILWNSATSSIPQWESCSWRYETDHNNDRWEEVENSDLWQLLLKETRRLKGQGVSVSFWYIPIDYDGELFKKAKEASYLAEIEDFVCPRPNGPLGIAFEPYTMS